MISAGSLDVAFEISCCICNRPCFYAGLQILFTSVHMFSIGNAKVRAILVACGGDLSMSAAEDPHVGTEPLTSGWSPKQEEDHVEWLLLLVTHS